MADRLVTETEASKRRRLLLEAAQDAGSASTEGEGGAPAAPEKPAAKPEEKTGVLASAQRGAGKVFPRFKQGVQEMAEAGAPAWEEKAKLPEGGTLTTRKEPSLIERIGQSAKGLGNAMFPFSAAGGSMAGDLSDWVNEGVTAAESDANIQEQIAALKKLAGGPTDFSQEIAALEAQAKIPFEERKRQRRETAELSGELGTGLVSGYTGAAKLAGKGVQAIKGAQGAADVASEAPKGYRGAGKATENVGPPPAGPMPVGDLKSVPEWAKKHEARLSWEKIQRAKQLKSKPAGHPSALNFDAIGKGQQPTPVPDAPPVGALDEAVEPVAPLAKTGDPVEDARAVVEQNGTAHWNGVQEDAKGKPAFAMFTDDVTKSTLMLKLDEVTPEGVESALAAKRAEFEQAQKPVVKGVDHAYIKDELDEVGVRHADEYDAAQTDPAARPAWDALAKSTDELYAEISKRIKAEPVTGEPYKTAAEMIEDMKKGSFKVSTDNSAHPFWTPEQNWRFRVVHDVLGHLDAGNDFSLKGEKAAFLSHVKHVTDDGAKGALQTEVYGQAASAVKNGRFSEQKAFLPKERITDAPARLTSREIHEQGAQGFTFDPRTGQMDAGRTGYAVSNTKGGSMDTPIQEFGPQHIDEFAALHAEELAEPDAFHGGWVQNGMMKQDVTRVVENEDEAHRIGRSTVPPQDAIWDRANQREIPVKPDPNAEVPLAPAETAPAKPDPVVEGGEETAADAVRKLLNPSTVADLHKIAEPVVKDAAAEAKQAAENYKAAHAAAQALAQEMRKAGASRAEINEAYKAKLNEMGVESKSQAAERVAKEEAERAAQPPPTPGGTIYPEEDFRAALARIKKRIDEIIQELNNEEGKVRLRGNIDEVIRKNAEVWNDLKAVGAGLLHYGAREYEVWADGMRQMLASSGVDITHLDKHLKELYPLAQKQLKVFNKTNHERDLPTMVELREAYRRGEYGGKWYDRAPEELLRRFGTEKNANIFAGAYAATSPQKDAATLNIDLAMRAYDQIVTGERDGVKRLFRPKRDGLMPVHATNLNRVARGERVSGPKIYPFEGQLRQDAFTSGARDIPVLDTWMGRIYGFLAEGTDAGTLSDAQRRFMETTITRLADEVGADVAQVQAALWVDIKAASERAEAFLRAEKKGTSLEALSKEIEAINERVGRPFDRLLLDRLAPAMEAIRHQTDPDSLIARRAGMAIVENKGEPEAAATVALQKMGMMKATAARVASKIADAYRESGLADETGSFNFWRKAGDPAPEYDKVAAEAALGARVESTGAKEILRASLVDEVLTPEQLASGAAARGAVLADLQKSLDTLHDGGELPPGDLYHSATLAGAVADKARSALHRYGPDAQPGRLVGGDKPITSRDLLAFGERLQRAMTEPELYAKLKSLDDEQRAQWLGNLYRSGERSGGLYMSLYMNSLLSNPSTWMKATMGDSSTLPLAVGNRFLATQWGRGFNLLEDMGWLTKSDTHVVPGESAVMATNYWENIKDQISMLARRDWDGIHQQAINEGEYHPPIAMPDSLAGSVVNAVAGAPSYILGMERAPHRVISRLGELRAQAWRQATAEGKTGEELVQLAAYYQQHPTKGMMDAALAAADENAFARDMDGFLSGAIQKATSTDAGKILIEPFARITMNIMDYTVQGTPVLNLVSKRWRADFMAGGARRDMAMGRLSMGTAIIGTGVTLGFQGLVTGDGPRDPAARKVWEAAGWRPNYIYNPVTGKPMISHLALGPISGWLAAGADAAFIFRHAKQQDASTVAAGLAMALMEPVTHAGYLEVFSDVVRAIREGLASDQTLKLMRDRIAMAALLKPGFVRGITENTGPEAKPASTPSRGEWYEREWQALKDDVTKAWPGWAEHLPNQRNFITGKSVARDGAAPWYHTVTGNKVAQEIDRLGQNRGKGAKFAVLPPPNFIGGSMPQEGVPLNDPSPYEAIRLESWEKDRLIQLYTEKVKVRGQNLEEALEALIASPKYRNKYTDGPYGTRAQALQGLYHAYVHAGQQMLLKEDKHLRWLVNEQLVAQARASGKTVKNPEGAEPEPTKYPRPGQKERP